MSQLGDKESDENQVVENNLVKITIDAVSARDLAQRILRATNAGDETVGKGTTITLRQDNHSVQYVQLNILKDLNTVRVPPGFEERAQEFWNRRCQRVDPVLGRGWDCIFDAGHKEGCLFTPWSSPTYLGTPLFDSKREEIMSRHLGEVHHCNCGELTAELQIERFFSKPGAMDPYREQRIEPTSLKGDCIRCHGPQPGVKLFHLSSNPSFLAYAQPGDGPRVTHITVCRNCLTDEEAAKILAPIAVFVIENLFIRLEQIPKSDLPRAANYIRAALVHRTGTVETYERSKEKAMKALG